MSDSLHYFVRFGKMPRDGLSKMWRSPNAFHTTEVGSRLPGMSVYEVEYHDGKWVLETENINVHCGISTLMELFQTNVDNRNQPIYLLQGTAVTWNSLSKIERKEFKDYWLGKGYENYPLQGTDGEPLVRDFKIVKNIDVFDMVCHMISFPKDFMDDFIEEAVSSPAEKKITPVNFSDCKFMTGKEISRLTASAPNKDLQPRIKYFWVEYTKDEDYFIIRAGKRIVAMTGIEQSPYDESVIWIKFVSVENDYQGKGLARKMIECLYSWAIEKGKKIQPSSFSDQGEERIKGIFQQMDAKHPGITNWPR